MYRTQILLASPGFTDLKQVFTVFRYLNRSRMIQTAIRLRDELQLIQTEWNARFPNNQINLREFWVQWYHAHLNFVSEEARRFVLLWIKEGLEHFNTIGFSDLYVGAFLDKFWSDMDDEIHLRDQDKLA